MAISRRNGTWLTARFVTHRCRGQVSSLGEPFTCTCPWSGSLQVRMAVESRNLPYDFSWPGGEVDEAQLPAEKLQGPSVLASLGCVTRNGMNRTGKGGCNLAIFHGNDDCVIEDARICKQNRAGKSKKVGRAEKRDGRTEMRSRVRTPPVQSRAGGRGKTRTRTLSTGRSPSPDWASNPVPIPIWQETLAGKKGTCQWKSGGGSCRLTSLALAAFSTESLSGRTEHPWMS
jgi:hypothetical protein